mmetsp:Transcript_2505/g.6800  ORF Transcript_2505/g.6800 Transcript_2505/m.6800 type:complete len:168 (+) Transcript_2505:138-641(+)
MKRRGENADRARPWLNWPARCGTRSIVRSAQYVGLNGDDGQMRFALGHTRGNERREEALGWVAVGEHWRTGLAVTSRKTRGEMSLRARVGAGARVCGRRRYNIRVERAMCGGASTVGKEKRHRRKNERNAASMTLDTSCVSHSAEFKAQRKLPHAFPRHRAKYMPRL